MNGLALRLASGMLSAASGLLPRHLAAWPRAMRRELAELPTDRAALAFAAGCVRAMLAVSLAERLRPLAGAVRFLLSPLSPSTWSHPTMNSISARPRLIGLACAAGAVAAGLAYMSAAGAPSAYLLVNLAALLLGAAAWLGLGRAAASGLAGAGAATLLMAALLLATALFGAVADGASRWVRIGPISLQVSLILVPAMVVLHARRPDAAGTVALALAALALAMQPDRAMAGVLAAALVALAAARPSRLSILAAAASGAAFGWTLLKPDRLPAVPYVDGILYSAFDVHPLAGAAITLGAAALLLPAIVGAAAGGADRRAYLGFGACWAGVLAAAVIGNYPTPLVGYGGSAVLGYLLSVALLPNGARRTVAGSAAASPAGDDASRDPHVSELCAARAA